MNTSSKKTNKKRQEPNIPTQADTLTASTWPSASTPSSPATSASHREKQLEKRAPSGRPETLPRLRRVNRPVIGRLPRIDHVTIDHSSFDVSPPITGSNRSRGQRRPHSPSLAPTFPLPCDCDMTQKLPDMHFQPFFIFHHKACYKLIAYSFSPVLVNLRIFL